MALIFVDVEALGMSPRRGTMTEFGAVEFKGRDTFHGKIWESEPDPANPAKPVIVGLQVKSVALVMREFRDWLSQFRGRPIFVSDNPAYDFQWINCAFDDAGMANPFGHSGRRIGDFYAGIRNDFYTSQDWKSLRKTPHDHNPVNDAMGNVEAFEQLLNLYVRRGERPSDSKSQEKAGGKA